VVRVIRRLAGCVAVILLAATGGGSAEEDFPLTGDYTQNVPCKGDGTDARELKVKISPQQIDSHVAVCTFLDVKRDGARIVAHVQCQFPRGPLMGDVTFKMRPDRTIEFIDRDKNYSAVLYRCPQ
jgi:hypothetical protein